MKVAAVQAEPAWLDLEGGVAKVISLMTEAASNGADIIGFPESFIPGYPMAIWAQPFNPPFLAQFQKNALDVKSEHMKNIQRAAKQNKIWVVLGFTEVDSLSMYASLVFINAEGNIVLHRRKLKATGQERTIWGDSPADSVISAVKGPEDVVIGGLNCWEHLQPLLRYHHYSLGVQVHFAAWPFCDSVAAGAPPHFSSDAQSLQAKFAALEGQMFVISSTQVISAQGAEIMNLKGTGMWEAKCGGGFAAIYRPDGIALTKPTDPSEETILYADLNFDAIRMSKLVADPVGHYSRPDLFSLKVNSQTKPHVSHEAADGEKERDYTLLGRQAKVDGQ